MLRPIALCLQKARKILKEGLSGEEVG